MPSEKYDRGRKRPAVVASVSLAFDLREIEGDSIGPITQIALLLAALALVIVAVARLIEAIGPLPNNQSNLVLGQSFDAPQGRASSLLPTTYQNVGFVDRSCRPGGVRIKPLPKTAPRSRNNRFHRAHRSRKPKTSHSATGGRVRSASRHAQPTRQVVPAQTGEESTSRSRKQSLHQ